MIGLDGLPQRAASAAAIAAAHADDVDTQGRFPEEAIRAFKEFRLLGLLVPEAYGGPGASLANVMSVCRTLGQACGSSALIFAMHQIQVACAIAGADENEWQRSFLERVAREQLLLASVTSEVGIGGDIRSSICAPIYDGDQISLVKHSSAISYGQHADALLVTARRHGEASASDQVLIVAEKENVTLAETSRWDTLGMRGTDSKAFDVALSVPAHQVLTAPFADIAQQAMLPTSHILWGGVWLGIATDAAEKARAFLRRQAQGSPGSNTAGGMRLERIASLLNTMRARLESALVDFGQSAAERGTSELNVATSLNALKVTVSESALEIVQEAMMICGIAGYKCGTPYSVGRQLRDLHSAPIMVNNDRIRANTALLLVAQRSPMTKA
jgi:acyl-CoA dehydrogenase